LLLSSVMMLRHMRMLAEADRLESAIMVTLMKGDRLTPDIARTTAVGTEAFADAVIEHLDWRMEAPTIGRVYHPIELPSSRTRTMDGADLSGRATVGVDIFIESAEYPEIIGGVLREVAAATVMDLRLISNRGAMVWPASDWSTDLVDHWRCRFVARRDDETIAEADILDLISRVAQHYHWVHVERLQTFDGEAGFSKAQGE